MDDAVSITIDSLKRETELAWAAGFFDGEGWVGMILKRSTKNGRYYEYYGVHLSINQATDDPTIIPDVLIRFKHAVNEIGGICFKPQKGKRRQQYMYYTAGSYAYDVLKLLWPYLSEIKRQQATKAGFRSE